MLDEYAQSAAQSFKAQFLRKTADEDEEEKSPEVDVLMSRLDLCLKERNRCFIVHEKDSQDFWNLKRWVLRRPTLLYRFAANDELTGVNDLRCGVDEDVDTLGDKVARIILARSDFPLEARFDDENDLKDFHELRECTYDTLKEKVQILRRELEDEREAVAELSGDTARLERALNDTDRKRQNEQIKFELEVDAFQAEKVSVVAALQLSLDGLQKENLNLKKAIVSEEAQRSTLSSQLAESLRRSEDLEADLVAKDIVWREAKKKDKAAISLLVREVKDLRKTLTKADLAKDAKDVVANFWDDDDDVQPATEDQDDDDDVVRWLQTFRRREEATEEEEPPTTNVAPLTPAQRAFMTKQQRGENTRKTHVPAIERPAALLQTLFAKVRQSPDWLPPAADPPPVAPPPAAVLEQPPHEVENVQEHPKVTL